MFCSLPFLLTIIWKKEEKLFVNLFIKVREVAHVFKKGLRSLVLQRRGIDRQMDGCGNLQNGIGAAPEKPASSKSMLACIPKSCRELAREESKFRVWFEKWFSFKTAIFERLLSAGIQSPACCSKARSTRLAAVECGGVGRRNACMGVGSPERSAATEKTIHGNESFSRFVSHPTFGRWVL